MARSTPWRRGLATSVAVVAVLVASACGSGSGAASGGGDQGPLRILYVSGVTGLLAPASKAVQRGMQAAVDSVNASGGVNGRKLELTTKDNQSDPTRGLTLIQDELSGDQPPDLIVPGVSSNECLAVAPLLSRQKRVGIGVSSTSKLDDPKQFPYYFSQAVSQKAPLDALAAYVKGKGGTSVAAVLPNDGLGETLNANLQDTLGKAGLTFSVERFAGDGVDFSAAFASAAATKPDYIFTDASGTQVPYVFESRIKAGAGTIPTIGGTSIAVQPVLDLTKGTDGMRDFQLMLVPGAVQRPSGDAPAAFTDFDDRVLAQGKIEVPLNTYGYGWDVVQTFAAAAGKVSGTFSQDGLKDSLEHLDKVDQLVGFTKLFSPTTHQVSPNQGDITIGTPVSQEGGQFVVT